MRIRLGWLGFVTAMERWPSEIRLVHGEAGAKAGLADALADAYEKRQQKVDIKFT